VTGGAAAARHDLRRALSRHRVLLSAGLAAGSVATAVTALSPAAAPTTAVVVAARDLSAGVPLRDDDLQTVDLPARAVPSGALDDPAAVVGRLVAGPVRAGEPLTDVRLLGAALLPPGPEVAAPVRVAERATAALVRAGDVVDVLSAAPDGRAAAATVVTAVRVLSVPLADDDAGEGALLVLAATRPAAARLAAAAVTGRLSVVVHGR
jgi:Flp pilus assembly protein CpaB